MSLMDISDKVSAHDATVHDCGAGTLIIEYSILIFSMFVHEEDIIQ